MQQCLHLSKKNSKVDPRSQFITDPIADIQSEQKIHSHIILLGDFNEDLNDDCDDSIK